MGARLVGGRWNHPGTAIVYASATLALAALEVLAGVDDEDAPKDFVAISADIPETVRLTHLRAADLPANWRDYPPPPSLRDLGTRWARTGETAVLAVPSAIVPKELNYLLNPRHPAFGRIRIGKAEAFSFDPRLWKR